MKERKRIPARAAGPDEARLREYNGFGPWIVEINDQNPMPALYVQYYHETELPLLLIKIPRRIERRAASIWMDLYDYVIGAFEDHIYILKRNGASVKEERIGYKDIAAVRRFHSLLKGELMIYLAGEPIRVSYSTVSDDIILRLISIIANKKGNAAQYRVQFKAMPVEYVHEKSASMDLYYVNLCDKLSGVVPDLYLVAYQPRIVLGRIRQSKLFRIQFRKLRMTKNAFLSDGKMLAVIVSEITTRNKTADGLAYDYLFLPIQSITDVRVAGFDREERYNRIDIAAGNHVFSYIYEATNGEMEALAKKLRGACKPT